MDKTSILKARVSQAPHDDFLVVCPAIDRTPAAMMQDFVQRLATKNQHLLESSMQVGIERSGDYQHAAWRARISLRNPDDMRFHVAPFPFELPRLQAQRIHPEKGYAVAASNWDGEGSDLTAIFINGVWEGHLYSNGIEGDASPISIEIVRNASEAAMNAAINAGR